MVLWSPRFLTVAGRLAEVLCHVASRHIVHGDVNAGNIVVGESGATTLAGCDRVSMEGDLGHASVHVP